MILLVNTDRHVLQAIAQVLRDAGLTVTAVESFTDARDLLDAGHVDLLIADIRLGAYNGLHLAQRARLAQQAIPVLITHAEPDVFFEHEAARARAGFLVDPSHNPDLLARVRMALAVGPHIESPTRRWPRKVVSSAIPALAAMRAAQILDLSYGGVKLALEAREQPPDIFELRLTGADLAVRVNRVWVSVLPNADVLCGAAVTDSASERWRTFVDSVA